MVWGCLDIHFLQYWCLNHINVLQIQNRRLTPQGWGDKGMHMTQALELWWDPRDRKQAIEIWGGAILHSKGLSHA